MEQRPNIFEYLDFREFAADMFAHLKHARKSFTHREFAERAGLGAPNAFKRVVDGHYGLPEETAVKFARGLGLDSKEKTYFLHLCAANQASDPRVRARHERKMTLLRNRHNETSDRTDQYEYLKNWYYVAIRELLQVAGAPQTPREIAEALYPPISTEEARQALDVLGRLGLIEKRGGRLTTSSQQFKTPPTVASRAVRQFNYQSLSLALDAMDALPVDKRQYGSLTLAVSKEQKRKIQKKLRAFLQEVLDECSETRAPTDEVLHVGLYVIPFSDPEGDDGE